MRLMFSERGLSSSDVGKKSIMAGAVGIASLLLITILLTVVRPGSVAVTVHHVKTSQSGQLIAATFQITNHTADRCFVFPRSVEANDGAKWSTCFEFTNSAELELGPFGCKALPLTVTNLPAGSHLRLSLAVVKELRGIKGLPGMLRLKLMDGVADVPLNPFDKFIAVGSREISIVSDEFVQPERN